MNKPLLRSHENNAPLALLDFFATLEAAGARARQLGAFDQGEPVSFRHAIGVAKLADNAEMSETDMRALLDAGLVERKNVSNPTLTASGRVLLDRVLTKMLPAVTDLAKTVSAPDMIDTTPLLRRIAAYEEPSGAA